MEARQRVLIQSLSTKPPIGMILSFTGEYRWLSNFQACNITLEEKEYAWHYKSTENAYMAWKVISTKLRDTLQNVTPRVAKNMSQTPDFQQYYRPDYTDVSRVIAMLRFSRQKYAGKNPELRQKLLATEDMTLVEGTTWNDKFFGFCLKTGMGQNYLGRILMTVRDEIREQEGLPKIYGDVDLLDM